MLMPFLVLIIYIVDCPSNLSSFSHFSQSLSPRQLALMASVSDGSDPNKPARAAISSSGSGSTIQEIPFDYLMKKIGGATALSPPK